VAFIKNIHIEQKGKKGSREQKKEEYKLEKDINYLESILMLLDNLFAEAHFSVE
jgi:hypothetical protein